MDDNIDKAEI